MKEAVSITESQNRKKKVRSWFDKVTFPYILILWVCIIIIFGIFYFYFSSESSYLYYTAKEESVQTLHDAIYFSFITATTTGFGDIIPHGKFKSFAIIEVVFGLLLLALVTSKLVSIKQNAIIDELYDLSLTEKTNRLRSSFLIFRQNLNRVISKIEDETISKREIAELYIYFSSFEDTLEQTLSLIDKQNNALTKGLDPVTTELILTSTTGAFEKITELLEIMNQKRLNWRRDLTIDLIKKCIQLNEQIFINKKIVMLLNQQKYEDLSERKNSFTKRIEKALLPEKKLAEFIKSFK